MSNYERQRRPIDVALLHVYRTKDFRAEPMLGGGYRVLGVHDDASAWLTEKGGGGFRKQFMDESGYLRAEDAHEVKALIMDLQREHG